VSKILTASHDALLNPTGEGFSLMLKGLVESAGYDKIVAVTSSLGKDIVPRLGAYLDV